MSDSNVASADPYLELPLDRAKQQVRLLKILKSDHGPVECALQVFDLDRAPPYTALSYRWGSTHTAYTISVNGRSFQVSGNLFHFLESYRREENGQYLWIDQICIAQTNIKERNHQVNLMSRIYGQCRSTIVWLCDDRDRYPIIAKEFNRAPTRKALLDLLNDSYFTRLWIVQEVLLSSNIWVFTAGNVWIPWHTIRECFLTRAWGPEHSIHKALVVPEIVLSGKRPTLGKCILTFSGQGCERLVDNVYGLLGIVPQRDRIDVDYSKSLDQVYLDAVIAVGPHGRDECAERLGNLFCIPSGRRDYLLAFLDFVQPIHCMGQVAVLHDQSPTTPYGSGLVTSVGLTFAEYPTFSEIRDPNRNNDGELFVLHELSRAVGPELYNSSSKDASDRVDGDTLVHEASILRDGSRPDVHPPFDPIQAIIDFHYCLHEAEWISKQFPDFVGQHWQTQEQIATEVFWTYTALCKRSSLFEQRALHSRRLICRTRWCFGYQGRVYKYARHPNWKLLFEFRANTELMRYVYQACSRTRSIIYQEPIKATEMDVHMVQRRHQEREFEPETGQIALLRFPSSEVHWTSCALDRKCRLYGPSVDFTEESHRQVYRKFPELRETW